MGVDFDDRYAARPGQVRQGRRWLDDAGGADHDDEVGLTAYFDRGVELRLGQRLLSRSCGVAGACGVGAG